MSLLLDALKEASNHRKADAELGDVESVNEAVLPENELELELNLEEIDSVSLEKEHIEPEPELNIMPEVSNDFDQGGEQQSNNADSKPVAHMAAGLVDTQKNEKAAKAVFRNQNKKNKVSNRFVIKLIPFFLLIFIVMAAYFYTAIKEIGFVESNALNNSKKDMITEMPSEIEIKPEGTQLTNTEKLNNVVVVSEIGNVEDVSINRYEIKESLQRQDSLALLKGRGGATDNQKETKPQTNNETEASSDKTSSQISIRKHRIPNNTRRLLSSAQRAMGAGDWTVASKNFRSVLETTPGNLDALIGMADVMVILGKQDVARAFYLRALEKTPENITARAGLLSMQADKTALSHGSDLKQLLVENPNLGYLHANLGDHHVGRHEWPAAQAAYFEAFRLNPLNANYAFNLAICLDQLGKVRIATDYYKQAIRLYQSETSRFEKQVVQARVQELSGDVQ